MASLEIKNIAPQSLITADHIKRVLRTDKGSDALLKSWEVVDFTKPGDNYACVVTSVEVKYSLANGVDYKVSYIVKLTACRNRKGFPDFTPTLFAKEGGFYQEIVPALNVILKSAGREPLHFPKCFLVITEKGKEQMYFADLRAQGFKMFDVREGISMDHVTLVLEELARLHSASHVLKNKLSEGEAVTTKYDFLAKDFLNFTEDSKEKVIAVLHSKIDSGIEILEKIGGYNTAVRWLERFKPEVSDVLTTGMQSKRFSAICHGDCWNNNLLFRYNDEGRPLEVMLVDLQLCRESSLACDLNYFLYTSVTGDIRTPNLHHLLSIYHSSYKAVLDGLKVPMHFSEVELFDECRSKHKVGILFALGVISVLLREREDVPVSKNTDWKKHMEETRRAALEKLDKNPLCKPLFLSVFDEFIDNGLIA